MEQLVARGARTLSQAGALMSEKMLLLQYSCNYADEFDVEGFIVMSESDWEEHKAMAAKIFEKRGRSIEVYFGTNEDVSYYDLEDYMRSFVVKELTEAQFQVLKDLFGIHYDEHTYSFDGETITVPAQDKIKNGMLAMLDSSYLE